MFESMDFASLLPTRQTTEERQAEVPEDDMCSILPTLTWQERLGGCGVCMVAGYLLSFGAFFRVKELITGNPGRELLRWPETESAVLRHYCISQHNDYFVSSALRTECYSWKHNKSLW